MTDPNKVLNQKRPNRRTAEGNKGKTAYKIEPSSAKQSATIFLSNKHDTTRPVPNQAGLTSKDNGCLRVEIVNRTVNKIHRRGYFTSFVTKIQIHVRDPSKCGRLKENFFLRPET